MHMQKSGDAAKLNVEPAVTTHPRVLCVDDDLIHLAALQTALKPFCNVSCAHSAEEAESILIRLLPDIVLLDISLPGQTGYSFCRRIRADGAFDITRIIILSAHHDISDRLLAYESGADDYVIKPFSADEIGAKIRVYHRLIRAERQLQEHQHVLEKLLADSAQEMKKKFTTDDETGFPNGLRFSMDLAHSPAPKTVILLNINGFGKINDAYGFAAANAILHSVALRLKQIGEARGFPIYRMRGADFAFLTEIVGLTPMHIAEFIADIQLKFSANPVRFAGFDVKITFSAGVALNETDQPLKKAALALEHSSRYGRGLHGIFSEAIDIKEKYEENLSWGRVIKNALQHRGIVPFFQGLHSNQSGQIEKYECLVRIRNDAGFYLPYQFLPAAEKLGLLTGITRAMIVQCFAYFQSLSADLQFSINIVEDDLADDGFLPFLESQFRQYRITPGQVIFEIVETASIAGKRAMRNLERIKQIGCLLALDDFGTENSNFARILNLQVDFIKIDGRFIGEMHRSRESFIVAKTITDFAHSIGAKAVAEFVHAAEVQQRVQEIGVDYSQGYLIHRPAAEIGAQSSAATR